MSDLTTNHVYYNLRQYTASLNFYQDNFLRLLDIENNVLVQNEIHNNFTHYLEVENHFFSIENNFVANLDTENPAVIKI